MRTNLRRAAAAALASSSLLFVAACGGSAEAEDKPAAKKSESAKPAPPAKPLTKAQAEGALLELKDMPPGWSVDQSVADQSEDAIERSLGKVDKAACQPLLDSEVGSEDNPKPQAYVVTGFAKDAEDGPFLTNAVTAYTAAEAKGLMAKPLPKGCDSFTGVVSYEEGDEKATFTFKEMPAPAIGDQAVAQRLTVNWANDDLQPTQLDLVAARVEGVIVAVQTDSPYDADDAALQAAFKKAVAKAEAATKAAK
ncbi:hypothetical protein [Streptomyces mesophilus]|uniref:hypothetical protein n=1 Tax=Streptomyces mesophilus TaxID=1775132 RepID=UPI0033204562